MKLLAAGDSRPRALGHSFFDNRGIMTTDLETAKHLRIYDWKTEADEACVAIKNNKVTLRIICKTKDEDDLIEKWILHYLNILEYDAKIIILDNMSTSKYVLQCYNKYSDRLIVIRFTGGYNSVHYISKFSKLYDAIWESSSFYSFIDTDEFIYIYNGIKLINDYSIIEYLKYTMSSGEGQEGINFFSPYLLSNAYFNDYMYKFNPNSIHRYSYFGKPILNSSIVRGKLFRNRLLIHTVHFPVSLRSNSPTCFVSLHMKDASISRRIKINMEKLRSDGIIKQCNDFYTVLNIDLKNVQHHAVKQFIEDVRHLIQHMNDPVKSISNDDIDPGHFAVLDNGHIKFFPEDLEVFFKQYVNKKFCFFNFDKQKYSYINNSDCTIWEVVDYEEYKRCTGNS